ncbi:MAG: PQQ-dependent sugar dehydrogenase [Planctomycetota bacterium]
MRLLFAIGGVIASVASPPSSAQTLTTEFVVGGLSRPVFVTAPPGDTDRLFIVEQRQSTTGRVRVFDLNAGMLETTPYLSVTVSTNSEQGVLGLAFHPDYQANGRFFVNYTNNSGSTRVAEYEVSATDPNVANPNRIQFIAQINQDFSNHNGGCIKFGPDGKLYVGMGDGGSFNDPNGRSQNPTQLLGKMLRYDVDIPSPFIPADNPFVGNGAVRDEIWHLGLRNPWRFTFDRVDGDMWIADVGQGAREEVNFIPAGLGGQNLGWRCLEGTRCTGLSGCSCSDGTLLGPIQEYDHGQGCSITGGMIYRGSAIPDLSGTYFYADYCTSRIWSLRYDGTSVSDFQLRTDELRPESGSINSITSFGEDFEGEVYIVTQGGRIWKIIEEEPPCIAENFCQALPTSNGFPVSIAASGSTSISDNNFVVAAGGLPPATIGLFFYGPAQTQQASGIGNLCVTGDATMPAIRLYPGVTADILGSVFRQVDFTDPNQASGPGAILPGMTLNFQCWFRDNDNGVPTWNFSDGVSVLFCP